MCEWDGYCAPDAGYDETQLGPWDDDERLARAIRSAKSRYKSAKRASAPNVQ
jgi:hypothetical protein